MAIGGLKTRVRFPSTINKENLETLRNLSKQTRIPMSVLMDEALEYLFEQYTDSGEKIKK